MTKNQSSFIRTMLFFAGIGIIILAFFLTKGDRKLSSTDTFTWISIGIMYLVFFLPFFFSVINITNFSGKIPSMIIVWLSIIFYLALSLGNIVLLAVIKIIMLNTAVIIQVILFFLFAICIYIAYFASSHINKVAAEETVKKQFVNELKQKANVLSLAVNKLPSEYDNSQKSLKQVLEDIKYIYPVDKGMGENLELQIIESINKLSELCGSIQSGAHPAGFDSDVENLRILVKERKLLRN